VYTDLAGKTALVTGAGKRSGIGFAIARKLAACGMNIVLADLGRTDCSANPVPTGGLAEMNELAGQLAAVHGVVCRSIAVDVGRTDSVAAMADAVKRDLGRVHVLCNNAGASFGVPNAVHTYDEAAWMATVDINLHGVFRVSKAIVPLMSGQGAGASIINTASRAGKVPAIFNGAYACAKAAVIMLTKVMAKELAGAGIRVNAICPGQIRTDLEKWRFELEAQFFGTTPEDREAQMCRTIPQARIGTTDEVADLAAFLASSASAYITGQAINICGGQLMEL
jgi:NAD(P)-dependent dehydrogenase (short-subunit alcohol dehydrogenase family)